MTQTPRGANACLALASDFRAALDEIAGEAWPATKWAKDPVGFTETILGVETWGKQQAILESVRDNRHTTVAGGRKSARTSPAVAPRSGGSRRSPTHGPCASARR